jgi:hypothetical protein
LDDMNNIKTVRSQSGEIVTLLGPATDYGWIKAIADTWDAATLRLLLEIDGVKPKVRAAAKLQIERIRQLPVHLAWIPVTSELPQPGLPVIIHCPDHSENVWVGFLTVGWWTIEGDQVTVTHWMHLPEPPSH